MNLSANFLKFTSYRKYSLVINDALGLQIAKWPTFAGLCRMLLNLDVHMLKSRSLQLVKFRESILQSLEASVITIGYKHYNQ